MRQLFDKRKWLAALISLTLIMGVMQPCLAESTQNDTEQTNTVEEASEESGEELFTPEAEAPDDDEEAQAEDLTDEEGTEADSEEEQQEGAALKTGEAAEEEDSSADVEFSDSSDRGESDTAAASEDSAVNVEPYVKKASMAYQSGEEWIDVNEKTTSIPVDARFKITLNYSGVSVEEVAGHGKSIRYTLPSLLMDPSVAYNMIQDGDGNEIGTIQADTDNRSILLTFTDKFLKKEEQEDLKQINGSFSFYASADAAKIRENPEQTLVIGNQEIKLDFEKDSDARLGRLDLQKNEGVYSKDENGEYLQYTLTVTTGDTEMPEVKITDQFTANKQYIDSYLGVTGQESPVAQKENGENIPYESGDRAGQGKLYLGNSSGNTGSIPEPAGTSVSQPGILVWNVGSMGANETRSLTYKVKLKTGYTGAQSRGTITNQAASFSKGYPHQTAKKDFTPFVNARIQKTAGSYQADSEGDGGTITYQVTVSADSRNTYTLNNVKIYDQMKVAQQYLSSLEYVRNSFTLSDARGNTITAQNPHQGKSNPDIKGYQFDFYVGTLQPGEQKTLTYQIKVKGNIYAAGNDEISIRNVAGVYSDDTVPPASGGNQLFASSTTTKSLGKKVWNRKLQSEKTDQDMEISIPSGEKIYRKDQDSWKEENVSSRTFTVPSGSYRYQVVVNEDGKWDVSSSVFGDALKNNYLAYTGYLKIDHYAEGLSSTPASDQEAVSLLEKQPVDHTVWVDINDGQTFSFSPADLNMAEKKGAFVLTYYAQPRNTENVSEVTSGNSFGLSGTVTGPGGTQTSFSGSGVQVNTSVIIEGGNKFEASKSGWYFEHNRTESGDWKFGRLYWVIDVSGREIQAGTQFRDIPSNSASKNLVRGTSMTGLYVGKVPDGKSFTEYYGSVSALESDSSMKKLTGNDRNGGTVPAGADYSWTADNEQATITIEKDITLQAGNHLYIVISTAPNSAMGNRDYRVFKNTLEVKDTSSSEFIKQNEADIRAVGAGTNFKEMAGVYEYDGTNWSIAQSISGNMSKKLCSDKITEAGTYVDWRIKINYAGDLEGKVSVEDLIPEGLDPVYVRYFWIHPEIFDSAPTVPEIPELEGNSQWKKMAMTGKIDGTNTGSHVYTCNAYYNEKTRQLRFDVENLQKGGDRQDKRSLEIQVVTKVSDTDMMLNGTQKTYTNGITVRNDSGNVISTSAANVTITKKTISKTKGNVTGSKLPFTITVNNLGEDLVRDSDTLTLVDELSNPLRFEPDLLAVKDQSGNTLTGISPVIEETKTGEKMTLKIPDDKKLTITYEASLNSAPDTSIEVNNSAYWFGYNQTIAQISNAIVSYHVEATAGTSASPVLSVKKVDKDNTSKVLRGAEFSLQEMNWDEASSSWKAAAGQKVLTGTTNEKGKVSFGKSGQDQQLKYNTVYCLKETKAPEGYVLDPTPGYYVIAQKEDSGYPQELTTWAEHGAKIYYSSSTYKITIYNRKGTLGISKSFLDVNGNEVDASKVPDGIYRFGLYDYKENRDYYNEKALQIVEIVSKDGKLSYKRDGVSIEKPEFTQLPVGGQFCVFELDGEQKPLTTGNKIFTAENGITFKVDYTKGTGAVTIPENGNAGSVEIINCRYVNIEPGTGIFTGSDFPYIAVLLLLGIACAVYLGICRKKKV